MTAKEVLYDSETLLRLVDSEMQELHADLSSDGQVVVSSPAPHSSQRDGDRQAKVGAELRRPKRRP